MRSNPDKATSDLFDKHLDLLFKLGSPFGVFELLCSMEGETWFPCNFMQVDSVLKWRVDQKLGPEGAGWTPEEKDSGNQMVGSYKFYTPPKTPA